MLLLQKVILLFSLFSVIYCECPNGGIIWNGNCYILNNSTKSSFKDAEIACQAINGHLTSIHDAFANDILQNAPSIFHEFDAEDFWIGANSLSSPKWEWTDGTPFDFHNWARNQPSNESRFNCAAENLFDGYWRTDDCFYLKYFVCLIQIETGFTSSTTAHIIPSTVTTPQTGRCENKYWKYFAPTNSCYSVMGGDVNWYIGEYLCKQNGAHLASIHSDAENSFINTHFVNLSPGLIGLFSNDSGVSWQWTDGTLFDYQLWSVANPGHDGLNCTALFDYHGNEKLGFFASIDCSYHDYESYFAVCKKPAL